MYCLTHDFIEAFMDFFRRQFKNHFVWWGIEIEVKKRGDCFMHRARSFLGSLAATNVWFLCHLGQSGWWISHEETVLYSMTITKGTKPLWNRHIFWILIYPTLRHFITMIFCLQNCSDLLWGKIVIVIENFFWNSRLKAENLQKFWDYWNCLNKLFQ